jgi:hypothetical protein
MMVVKQTARRRGVSEKQILCGNDQKPRGVQIRSSFVRYPTLSILPKGWATRDVG